MENNKTIRFKVVSKTEQFEVKSNLEIYESDSFVYKDQSYYVHHREGNTLHVKPITKTVHVFD